MFQPNLGRWMQQDPMGFEAGDENLYRYVGNNSTNRTDPSGLDWTETEVSKLLSRTPSGRNALDLIDKYQIKVLKAKNLRWEEVVSATGKVVKSGKVFGLTNPPKMPAKRGDVSILVDGGLDPFTAAATVVHEVEHAQKYYTGRGGDETDARKEDLKFYVEHDLLTLLPDEYFQIPIKGRDKQGNNIQGRPIVKIGKSGCLEVDPRGLQDSWGKGYKPPPEGHEWRYTNDGTTEMKIGFIRMNMGPPKPTLGPPPRLVG